jgi:tol-pal system protein YbgF
MSKTSAFIVSLKLVAVGGLLAMAISTSAEVQNPIVVESRGDGEKPFRSPVVETEPISGMENQYQLQLLQQDVLEIRGLVEELSPELQVMKSRQEDRYLELDRRFEDFRRQSGKSVAAMEVAPPESVDQLHTRPQSSVPVATSGDSEKVLYDTSLELIRNRQYEQAIKQLQQVISRFPDGDYAPNAYYWLGEVYAAMPNPDYEMARQSLAQVISFFPDNRKVPDAAFKLGKVYNLMGDCARARDILEQVIQQNQGKTVAKLAETYLREKVVCEN